MAAAAAAEAAIQKLLSSLGDAAVAVIDTEVLAYLVSVVEDPDPESSLELISSVLAECVGAFAALDAEHQTELVLQLLDDAKPGGAEVCSSTAQGADDSSSMQAAVAAALQQTKLLDDACGDITNTRAAAAAGSRSSSSDSRSSCGRGPEADVGPLLELCPAGISGQFVQHCLQHSLQGDMQAAANWLLESDPAQLLRQQQAWEREAEQRELQRQEAERQKRQQKKAIVEKFDLRAVSDGSGPSSRKGGAAAADLLAVPKKAQQQASKLRYRDGKVVTTKGEKVIVEKVGEDWDGGSRGKVYTKGKRGKGFH